MVGTDLASANRFLRMAMQETPEQLAMLKITTGNEMPMADVIREAISFGLENRV